MKNPFRRKPEALVVAEVEGERTIPSVNAQGSMQSRMIRLMVYALVVGMGAAFLVWYYTTQMGRLADAQNAAKAKLVKRATADQHVPPLGRIDPPIRPLTSATSVGVTAVVGDTAPPLHPASPTATQQPQRAGPAASAPRVKTAADIERELQYAPVVMQQPAGGGPAAIGQAATATAVAALGGGDTNSALGGMLRPTATAAVAATRLSDLRYLLPKGAAIDCTLETAIDSTLPGMTRCIGATDVFSADGSLVLLEKGTRYTGETRGEAKQGQSRVFVLWPEATTANGVRVKLDSPGTDALGRSGLAGWVDTHFWDRFGAAILLSVIDSSVLALAGSGGNGGTAVAINPTAGSNVAAEALKSTVNIPPTININQGARVQIMVARDVDFRSVYELRAKE